jgi:hypothetical protein
MQVRKYVLDQSTTERSDPVTKRTAIHSLQRNRGVSQLLEGTLSGAYRTLSNPLKVTKNKE